MSKLTDLSDMWRNRNSARRDAWPDAPMSSSSSSEIADLWGATQGDDETIVGQAVTSIELADDGSRFGISFACNGKRFSLNLPIDCLNGLIMTLPGVMKRALQLRHRDDSLRLVYPASAVRIERSSDPKLAIATFVTPDRFEVSFSLTGEQIKAFRDAASVVDHSRGKTAAEIFN
jgi:hypothetical protein